MIHRTTSSFGHHQHIASLDDFVLLLCSSTLNQFRVWLPYSNESPDCSYQTTSHQLAFLQTVDHLADWDLAMKLRAYSLSLSIVLASLVSAQTIQEIVRRL